MIEGRFPVRGASGHASAVVVGSAVVLAEPVPDAARPVGIMKSRSNASPASWSSCSKAVGPALGDRETRLGDMATVMERLMHAQNVHDVEEIAALFAPDYRSVQPAHPSRGFGGRAQVQANWTSIFEGVPDFIVELVSSSVTGDTEWSEWEWRGRHADGSSFAMRGVIIAVVRDDLIASARLYMEPVDEVEEDIDAAVRRVFRPPASPSS
jgi:ketosteroid isomerase-like protein